MTSDRQFVVRWLFPPATLSLSGGVKMVNDTEPLGHSPSSGGQSLGSALRSPSPVSTALAIQLCLVLDLKAAASLRRSADS